MGGQVCDFPVNSESWSAQPLATWLLEANKKGGRQLWKLGIVSQYQPAIEDETCIELHIKLSVYHLLWKADMKNLILSEVFTWLTTCLYIDFISYAGHILTTLVKSWVMLLVHYTCRDTYPLRQGYDISPKVIWKTQSLISLYLYIKKSVTVLRFHSLPVPIFRLSQLLETQFRNQIQAQNEI